MSLLGHIKRAAGYVQAEAPLGKAAEDLTGCNSLFEEPFFHEQVETCSQVRRPALAGQVPSTRQYVVL